MKDEISQLEELIRQCKDGFNWYKDKFVELENAYTLSHTRGYLDEAIKINKSHLYVPKIFSRVARIKASLNEVYFQDERMANLENFINSNQEVLKMWQEAIDLYTAKIPFFTIAQGFFQQACVLGTAIAKVFYNESKDLVEIANVDIDTIFFDPRAKSREDIRVVIEEQFLSPDIIKAYVKKGLFEDLFSEDENELNKKRIALQNVYQKEKEDWYITTVYKSKILRKKEKLKDGLPFVFGYMLRQYKTLDNDNYVSAYGESPVACILPLQKEINFLRNASIDATHQSLTPKYVIKKSVMLNKFDVLNAMKPIYVNNQDDIRELGRPSLNSVMGQISLIDNEISESTGISAQNMGADNSMLAQQSATEISIKASEGGIRIGDYIRNFNETFFEPMWERFAKLVYKYADDALFDGRERRDLPSFKFNIQTGDGSTNKEVQKVSISNAIQVVTQLVSMQANLQDLAGAKRGVKTCESLTAQLLSLLNIKGLPSLEATPEEEAQEAMQEQLMQMQGQMPQEEAMEQEIPPELLAQIQGANLPVEEEEQIPVEEEEDELQEDDDEETRRIKEALYNI